MQVSWGLKHPVNVSLISPSFAWVRYVSQHEWSLVEHYGIKISRWSKQRTVRGNITSRFWALISLNVFVYLCFSKLFKVISTWIYLSLFPKNKFYFHKLHSKLRYILFQYQCQMFWNKLIFWIKLISNAIWALINYLIKSGWLAIVGWVNFVFSCLDQ